MTQTHAGVVSLFMAAFIWYQHIIRYTGNQRMKKTAFKFYHDEKCKCDEPWFNVKAVLGLLLLFFNISIAHLELPTTSLGVYLLITALWQIGPNTPPLRRAFWCSLALVAFKAAGLVLTCMRHAGTIQFTFSNGLTSTENTDQTLWLSLFGTAATLATLYTLFRGLGVLAEQIGDMLLSQRLNRCFYLYLGYAALLYAMLLFPAFGLLAVLTAFIVCIYILVQVSRFGKLADNAESFRERRLSAAVFTAPPKAASYLFWVPV